MEYTTRILIVEDEVITALSIERMIKNFNFKNVAIANDDKEAMQKVIDFKPELILMDINLGKHSKDGIQIATEIQKTSIIPIIYISAYADEKTIIRTLRTHSVGYIYKPINRKDLKEALLMAVSKKDQDKEIEQIDIQKN